MVLDRETNEPKKQLGQHWLFDETILESIANEIAPSAGDTVLEIGPGLGTLTAVLLDRGADVVALEYDQTLADQLPARIQRAGGDVSRLTVKGEDIRRFNFTTLPADYKICANIPYYLTSNLLRLLCDTPHKPTSISLLMQKEVAERVVGVKGRLDLLSVIVGYYYEPRLGVVVGAEYFTPPPKVDSQVLTLERRAKPRFTADTTKLIRLFKAGFGEKRKNLRNALSAGLHIDKSLVEQILETAGIHHQTRAEALSFEQWQALYVALTDTVDSF